MWYKCAILKCACHLLVRVRCCLAIDKGGGDDGFGVSSVEGGLGVLGFITSMLGGVLLNYENGARNQLKKLILIYNYIKNKTVPIVTQKMCHCNATLCEWKSISNHYMWTWVAKTITTRNEIKSNVNNRTFQTKSSKQIKNTIIMSTRNFLEIPKKQLLKKSVGKTSLYTAPANAFVDRRKNIKN